MSLVQNIANYFLSDLRILLTCEIMNYYNCIEVYTDKLQDINFTLLYATTLTTLKIFSDIEFAPIYPP